MRRGGRNARSRGRGRGQPPRHIQPLMKIKPFQDNEIENINMELEILKQKRQMIEEHQNILKNQIMYSQRQFDSEKPRYYEQSSYDSPGPSRSNRNFARFYDDPAEERDYIPLNSGRKRPADDNWPRGSGAKRFGSRRGGVVQSFGSRLGPRPAQSQTSAPQAGPSGPPPNARKRTRSDSPPPGILLPQIVPKNRTANKDREKYTLRADREPCTALNGLLELGVGFLLKQMKQKYGNSHQYGRIVTRLYYARRLKKALRSRIRKIMMNKYVDNYVDVVDQYRKRFPMRTDEELVIAASKGEIRESPTGTEPDPSTEAPRAGMPCPNFFKKKMQRFVGAKLRTMFNEIREMYNPPNEENTESTGVSSSDVIMVEDKEKPVDVAPTKGQGKRNKWKIDLATLLHDRLRSVIQFHIPTITTILNMDPEYISTKASLLAMTMKMDPTIRSEVVTGYVEEPETIQICDDPKPTQYFAKVRGLPNLPQRDIMRPFLDTFKPQAIKTHKKMKNLLIVTFRDKDSYDKFLLQDGVAVGDCTIDIKVSGKVNPVQTQTNGNENIDTGTDSQDSNEKNAVSIELTNQINHLLSSIRWGDEQAFIDNENKSTSDKSTDKANGNEPQTEDIVKSTENINECGQQNEVNEPNDEQNDHIANEAQTEDIVKSTENINECGQQNEVNEPNDEQNDHIANEPQTEDIVKSTENINECGQQNEVNEPNDEQNDHIASNDNTEATDDLQTANTVGEDEGNVNAEIDNATKDSSANEETKE